MAAAYTLKSEHPTTQTAGDGARPMLEAAEARLGFVPNMYKGMAIAPGVLDTYMHGYELFRQNSGFTPPEQEVIFLTISRCNGCEYCVWAHSMLAENVSTVPGPTLEAIREGQSIPDSRLAALSRFTQVMFETRGRPGDADVQAFMDAGFAEEHIMQIILALAVKTLSNYSNHVTRPALDEAFSAHAWKA